MFRFKRISFILIAVFVCVGFALVGLSNSSVSGNEAAELDVYLPVILKPSSQLPDLTIPFAKITLENNPPCYDGQPLGTEALVENIGFSGSGPVVVEFNGTPVAVSGLDMAANKTVWVEGYKMGDLTLAIADLTNVIAEVDEANNVFNGMLPVPTPPIPCPTATTPPNNTCSYNTYNCTD